MDLNEAASRGWKIDPVYRAKKDGHVFNGTAAEILPRVAQVEERHVVLREQHQESRRQQEHAPITRLLATLERQLRAYVAAWEEYEAHKGDAHERAMRALQRATAKLAQATETLLALVKQPKDALLSHQDFIEFQKRIKSA